MITVEQKVAAFDALVKLLDHRPRLIGHQRVVPRFTLDSRADEPILRDVPIYEYRLQFLGEMNIEAVLLTLAKQK